MIIHCKTLTVPGFLKTESHNFSNKKIKKLVNCSEKSLYYTFTIPLQSSSHSH